MATQEQLVKALAGLPDDVKSRLSSATPEQRSAFVKNISMQLGQSEEISTAPAEQDSPGGVVGFIKSQKFNSPLYGIPTNKAELQDLGKVALRQIPGVRGYDINPGVKAVMQGLPQAAFDMGLMAGGQAATSLGATQRIAALTNEDRTQSISAFVQPPSTEYGKNMETGADNLPFAALAGAGLGKARMFGLRGNPEYTVGLPNKRVIVNNVNTLKKEAGVLAGNKVDEALKRFHEANSRLSSDFKKALDDSGFTGKQLDKESFFLLFKKVFEKAGIDKKLATELTPAELELTNYARAIQKDKNAMVTGSDIYDKLKNMAGDRGTRIWGAFNDALGETFPELQKVRSAFANRIQDKKLAEKALSPHNTQGGKEVTRAFGFLSKAASSMLNEADKRKANAVDRFLGNGFFSDLKSHAEKISGQEAFLNYLRDKDAFDPVASDTSGVAKKTAKAVYGVAKLAKKAITGV